MAKSIKPRKIDITIVSTDPTTIEPNFAVNKSLTLLFITFLSSLLISPLSLYLGYFFLAKKAVTMFVKICVTNATTR